MNPELDVTNWREMSEEQKVRILNVALRMVGFNLDHKATDLILQTMRLVEEKGGDAALSDATRLQFQHKEKYAVKPEETPKTY